MEKHKQGTVSELLAASYFVQNGYIVSKPVNDFNSYDLVADNGDKLLRVQVKTAYWDNSKKRYLISCVTSHIRGNNKRYNKKYKENAFDILCAVHSGTSSVYLIPLKEITGRRSITVYPASSEKKGFEQYKRRIG